MNKSLFISAILFGLAVVVWVLLVQPMYNGYKQAGIRMAEAESALEDRSQYIQQTLELQRQFENSLSELKKIDLALLDSEELPLSHYRMEQLTRQSGMLLDGIEITPLSAGAIPDGPQETEATLTFTGTYSAFKGFLNTLEQSASLYNIHSVSISEPEVDEEGAGEGLFQFGITMSTYSYRNN